MWSMVQWQKNTTKIRNLMWFPTTSTETPASVECAWIGQHLPCSGSPALVTCVHVLIFTYKAFPGLERVTCWSTFLQECWPSPPDPRCPSSYRLPHQGRPDSLPPGIGASWLWHHPTGTDFRSSCTWPPPSQPSRNLLKTTLCIEAFHDIFSQWWPNCACLPIYFLILTEICSC